MTERKWTPGPWFAVRNNAYWEINPARKYGDDDIPYTVGNVCASDPSDTKGRQEPNAHLIAAAPDLYDALEAARDVLEALNIDTAAANAALAKARGET